MSILLACPQVAAQNADGKPAAPASAPVVLTPPPTTKTGSLAPGVFFEDVSYTMRRSWNECITVNPHNPDIAYVGSYDGFVWRTTDGGQTWDEWRLVHETKNFWGDAAQRVYFGVHRNGTAAWGRRHMTSVFSTSPVRGGRSKLMSMRPQQVGMSAIKPGASDRVSAAANVNFGVGLAGRAPRLQTIVRKFTYSRPTNLGMTIGAAGLNIKQTLLFRGLRRTEVRRIIIHPTDPKVVFAATYFGLFKTYDGGLTWVRTFQGINPLEMLIFHVAINPKNPDQVLIATGNGVYASNDGGENFMKSTAKGVGEGVLDWIYFNPYDPRYVFACTNYGLLRSSDGGKNWQWIYFTTFPTARLVRMVVIDPFDKRRGYIATHDGVFTTPNLLTGSLEDWSRMGGLRFTSNEISKIEVCPKHKGHLWVLTNTKLPMADPYRNGNREAGGSFISESIDGGKSWRVIYSGSSQGTMMWFDIDPRDPDMLWIAWSRTILRMRRPHHIRRGTREKVRRAEVALSKLPSFTQAMQAAMYFTGVQATRRLKYRRLARLRSLVPRIDASYTYYRLRAHPLLHDGLYLLPFRQRQRIDYKFHDFRVMLYWDLSDLLFHLDASLFGRIARISGELEALMVHSMQRKYGELQRLHARMITKPPDDLRVRLMYRLRIKELESYIDLYTGGYLTRFRQGDNPKPSDTPWFDIWPGIGDEWIRGADH